MDVPALLRDLRRSAGLTQADLARRAGTSQAAVARYETGVSSPSVSTLERLARAAGSELHISAVEAAASSLTSPRAQKVRRHRGQINRLARTAGASNLRLFGSVARGDDTQHSDIDLLVDYEVSHGLMPIVTLARELSELLGEVVDVAPVQALRPDVAARALAEAVPL